MSEVITYSTRAHTALELIDHIYSYLLYDKDLVADCYQDKENDLIVVKARPLNALMDRAIILQFCIRESQQKVTVHLGFGNWENGTLILMDSALGPVQAVGRAYCHFKQNSLLKDICKKMNSFMNA